MHAIPPFPEFVSLGINHKSLIQEITHRFPAYSDFNFISLFSWDTEASIGLALLHNNLIVRFSDYDDSSIFLSLIGTHQLGKTIPELFDYCKAHKLPLELRLVPQSVVDALPASIHQAYDVVENRDNHDYILSVKNISELGADYQRKRKAVNRFSNRHGGAITHSPLDLDEPKIVAEIHTVMEDWKQSRKRGDKEDEKEFAAISRTLQHAEQLGIRAYGLRIDGRLIAFTLFEICPQDVAVFHFTKANVEFEGVFEYLKHSLAKHLVGLGVQYINIEQDLGVDGLRRAKESYKPVRFLKKYTISPKP